MAGRNDPLKPDSTKVVDDTPFPEPSLYFKVFDSEKDEPESKYRQDVFKLYDKWQKEYGRRWPEDGMKTEDIVWLVEEADKDMRAKLDAQYSAGPGYVPNEREDFPGQFLPEPNARAPSNYELTKAGAQWVTDEFESDAYEAGNVEQLWDMYLFDKEGKPIFMPSEPAQEEQGEESEQWMDYHGAWRPRHVDSEEHREAVWVTDEFESDEDNTESEWWPEYVGAGLGLKHEDPINPQYSLRHSNHPLAPFPGDPLLWSSWVYADGTAFEGLTRQNIPHGMGVMTFGNGTGAGMHFREVRRGDRYEGEFQAGFAHGLGQFTSESRGEVYIGEFFAGKRHGCGVKINMKPYYYLMERGMSPVDAYQKTYQQIMRNMEFRTWYHGRALGDNYEDETIFQPVIDDQISNPYDVITRNALHESKLKRWKEMNPEQKAMSRLVDVMDMVQKEGAVGMGYVGSDSEDIAAAAIDDGHDSIDLMVGNTTDGGYGYGWDDPTQDSDIFTVDPEVQEEALADVIAERDEESEDKEQILGNDLMNPFTGLSVKDYLEGREGLFKPHWDRKKYDKKTGVYRGVDATDEDTTYLADEETLSNADEILADYQSWADLTRDDDNPYAPPRPKHTEKPWFQEDTDTRFETESDMMELCDLAEILGTIDEAQEIVARARMWRFKPWGEVSITLAQDGNGAPVTLMQDPMHYPHGTKFMAPGPLGQVHPIPSDPSIRLEMARVAKNYKAIYEKYNFDYDPEPGTAQWIVDQRIRRAADLHDRRIARLAEAAELPLSELMPANEQMQLAVAEPVKPSGQVFMPQGPFASVSFGMSRASKVVMHTLSNAAKCAPRRPHVMRPSHMNKKAQQ